MHRILRVSTALVAVLLLSALTATAAFAQEAENEISQEGTIEQEISQEAENKCYIDQDATATSGNATAAVFASATTGNAGAANIADCKQVNVQVQNAAQFANLQQAQNVAAAQIAAALGE